MGPYPAIAFGIDLHLTSTAEGGRSEPLLNVRDRMWSYRPNWGLPSMTPPEQSGTPVLAFSRDVVQPGENVRAVIVTVFPGMVAQWDREVAPGTTLPMYEGERVFGHDTVIWRSEVVLPLPEHDEQRLMAWLADPARLGEA